MTQLSEHFTSDELSCRCGCGLLPGLDFIDELEDLRKVCGFPFIITSGARCPAHNAEVSGTREYGPHVITQMRYEIGCGAVDISIQGSQAVVLVSRAVDLWTGIGLKQHGPLAGRFIHLDNHISSPTMPRPRIWTYGG